MQVSDLFLLFGFWLNTCAFCIIVQVSQLLCLWMQTLGYIVFCCNNFWSYWLFSMHYAVQQMAIFPCRLQRYLPTAQFSTIHCNQIPVVIVGKDKWVVSAGLIKTMLPGLWLSLSASNNIKRYGYELGEYTYSLSHDLLQRLLDQQAIDHIVSP